MQSESLEYRSVKRENPQGVVVMLHGYGASMDDLYDLHAYLDPNKKFDWYFPNGHLRVPIGPMMEGRAWFPVDMMELQRAMESNSFRSFADKTPEDFVTAKKILSDFFKLISKDYEQVILGGFSQGAMMSSHLASCLDNLAGLLIYSGVVISEDNLNNSFSKIKKEKTLFLQSHGKFDPVLGFSQGEELYTKFKAAGINGEFISFDGQHEIPMNVLEKSRALLAKLES